MSWAKDFGVEFIHELDAVEQLERRSKALAVLDAILIPEWEDRYFSFNCRWNSAQVERMASMRNGHGDEYFILFSQNGAVGKVYCDEDQLAHEAARAAVPPTFAGFMTEAAFSIATSTFFFWNVGTQGAWSVAPTQPNGYAWLGFLSRGPSVYREWVSAYLEKEVDSKAVDQVFETLTVTEKLVAQLNSDRDLSELAEDLDEIGTSIR
jgi:hypothetical protein